MGYLAADEVFFQEDVPQISLLLFALMGGPKELARSIEEPHDMDRQYLRRFSF
jgi:hypothetical protein